MNNLLINKYSNLLPIYLEENYVKSVEQLSSHMKNKHYYLHDRRVVYNNVTISDDFSTKNLNQAYFFNCKFNNSNLSKVSFVNSRFIDCDFSACDLSSTNFRGSSLINCSFINNNIFSNCKFGNCRIQNCDFDGCDFNSVILDEAKLIDSSIHDCTWNAVSTDVCYFVRTMFSSVKFRNMNFEFSIFDNIKMENLKIPFPTIPYIYGGLQYIISTSDKISITSQHNIKDGISKDEYISELKNLEIFYSYTSNYFPLANIYLAQNKKELCESAIIYGINKAIKIEDYKSICNFARLIYLYSIFPIHERYELYDHIIKSIKNNSQSTNEEFIKHLYTIRTYLFNSGNDSSFHLSIRTNIENTEKLVYLVEYLENCFSRKTQLSYYNIEIRHNSPFEIFINYFSDYETVCYILALIVFGLKGVDSLLKKVTSHIKDIQEIKKQKLENQILNQQIEKNKLEIEKERLELLKNTEEIKEETTNDKHDDIKNFGGNKEISIFNVKDIKIINVSYYITTINNYNIIPPADLFQ